jgi:hypothetical protein
MRGREAKKLVLFQTADQAEPVPGLLIDPGVVEISSAVEKSHMPQTTMQTTIYHFDRLRPGLEWQAQARPADWRGASAGAVAAALEDTCALRFKSAHRSRD